MTKDEYYSLKKGDIVKFSDTGERCVVLHFDIDGDFRHQPRKHLCKPNTSQCIGVIFISDNYRIVGGRDEFDYINRKKI